MFQQSTYLELSEEGEGAHKFYEVVQSGVEVTISYGRIGERGQVKTTSFPTEAKATAAASKKIAEKVRKGYAPAVRGMRQRRAVTRRQVVSHTSTATQAPVLWRFMSGDSAFGVFVDDRRCWVGNQGGDVYTLTHDGEVTRRFRLPDGVKCLVGDDFWIYAGCDDGKVYDLSGKVPRVAYEIAPDVDIYWLDICDGVLGVSDEAGRVTAIDHEDEFQWARKGGGACGWMVRCDMTAVYHGDSRGVSRYEASDGAPTWQTRLRGSVLFGWQEDNDVYAGCSDNAVYRLAKADGAVSAVYRTDSTVFSCAAAPDGRYVFAGDDHSSVYCFDADGTRLWKLATGCGSALSMQFLDDRLYIVTTAGALACIDASEAAVEQATQGTVPVPVDVKVAATLATVEPTAVLETTDHVGDGIVVECVRDGSGLRVRVVGSGYQPSWNVQFPKEIREAGARYLVEGVRAAGRGGFYRAYGEIKRLL
ncbi:WGR domain-containing protein, predicted DNA-binding domain in MolR [Sinosporangium album]|uniref:WGR domain-containing protein, predicted DNA-binding domain in MolR n=1 Tax=Sinosporangium album TaxID=504805 RepID=A0A1G7WKK2_9ACTN|nr:WGR domain-containing protein [Sinosporangium album]SDG72452.1 WGR domain-containing protein, predicted DNA-binding domain in MolR [Sinosporangium album]